MSLSCVMITCLETLSELHIAPLNISAHTPFSNCQFIASDEETLAVCKECKETVHIYIYIYFFLKASYANLK